MATPPKFSTGTPAPDSPPKAPSAPPSMSSSSSGTGAAPGQMGGAGAWMAHVKKTMRANPGKKLKEVLKLAKKTYHKGTKKTARKTRKSKSWFMGGSGTIVASPYGSGASSQAGASRHRRGRKH